MVQHHDRRAHVRVDVAEDLDQAGLREPLFTRLALPVPSEIEGPGAGQRKHVVEVGIVVRERHDRPARDDGHSRREGFVSLFDHAARGRQDALKGGAFQVDDDVLDLRALAGLVAADRARLVDVGGQRHAPDSGRQGDTSGDGPHVWSLAAGSGNGEQCGDGSCQKAHS